jgi:hypothetical protein
MLKKSYVIGRIVTAVCLTSCINLAGFSQTNKVLSARNVAARGQERVKETLIGLEKKSWEAWKNHDGKFFQDFLSDDHVEVGFGGSTEKAMVVKVVASANFCTVKSYSVDRFQVTMFNANTALLTYHAAQDTTCGGNAVPSPVWASSLYIKRGNRWLNAVYQQTQTSK